MGYTDFDRALLDAWHRAHQECRDDSEKLAGILRRRAMSTYTRPLRSWSLVLRACDSRIDDNNSMGLVRMDGARIKQLCSNVKIDYPGVDLDTAARDFGVNRTTVSRWANPVDSGLTWYQDVQGQIEAMSDMKWPPRTYEVEGKRLMLAYFHNVANTNLSSVRVWTDQYFGIDPSGEVWSADWGELRVGLADKVDPDFVQQLQRVDRKLGRAEGALAPGSERALANPGAEAPSAKGPRARVWQWVCPKFDGGCGRLVYKLYLPMPVWTLVDAYAGKYAHDAQPSHDEATPSAFLCLRCAGLVYESAERRSSPGKRKDGTRRRLNANDRFIKRISGGVVQARSMDCSILD